MPALPSGADAPELALPVRAWLAWLAEQRRVSAHTLSAYRRDLATLTRLAGAASGDSLEKLQAHQIRRYVAQLHGEGVSGRSLGRVLSAWRGFFGWLAREGKVDHDPCVGIRPPKSPRRLPASLSPDEAAHLLDASTVADEDIGSRDQAMFELFYSSGLRLAELASLDVDCLSDLGEGEIRVTGKRSKTRIVPVGTKAREAIDRWLAQRGGLAASGESALFVSRRGGRLSMRSIQTRLALRAQEAGLARKVHPHLLRHSFASHVLQSSGDLRAVQEMLGHASIASTQVYTHLDFQHLAKVYDAAHPRAKKK